MQFQIIITIGLAILFLDSVKGQLSCPPPTPVQVCDTTCELDTQCEDNKKCCPTACGGTYCVHPVTTRSNINFVKPGSCPDPNEPNRSWVCGNRCSGDSDCKGRAKCCKNNCGGLACMMPDV